MSNATDRTPLVGGATSGSQSQQQQATSSSSSGTAGDSTTSSHYQNMSDNNNNENNGDNNIDTEKAQSESPRDSNNNSNNNKEDEPAVPEQTAWIFSIIMLCISCGVCVATHLWFEAVIAFGINYLVFGCYAWPFHTEKIYDFTGMLTFLALDLFGFFYWDNAFNQVRSIVTFCMPLIWTLRLGLFLFKRILGEGGRDKRFDPIRNNFPRFFMSWTLQGVWAYFCMLPVLVVQKQANLEIDLKVTDYIGWGLWIFGFGFEVIADYQKTKFKENSANRGKFTNTGLWSISRHPNYFGEIVLWIGLSIVACSVATDWLWLMFLSPIWTMVLLIGLSGIPLSEKTADKKYGNTDGYVEYKAKTPVLIPFFYCWK